MPNPNNFYQSKPNQNDTEKEALPNHQIKTQMIDEQTKRFRILNAFADFTQAWHVYESLVTRDENILALSKKASMIDLVELKLDDNAFEFLKRDPKVDKNMSVDFLRVLPLVEQVLSLKEPNAGAAEKSAFRM